MAPPTNDIMAVVKLAAAGKYLKSKERRRTVLKLPAPESVEGMVIDAAYATIGTVEEARLSPATLNAAQKKE